MKYTIDSGKENKLQENFDTLIWRVNEYDPRVIESVVCSIPDSIMQNPQTTYADLSMGGGQFLQGILDQCIKLGQSKDQILPRLFGFEQSRVYLNYARWKNDLQGVNFSILNMGKNFDTSVMKFDVIIGNPPYSDTENVKGAGLGGCSKGLDDKFFLKCMEMSPFVSLIIRSKFFAKKSSKFRRKLFSSGHIQSMVALPESVFPTIGLTETVVVTYNINHSGPTKVTFQGGEEKEILLTEDTCLKFTNSEYVSNVEGNLASRHSMGSVGLNQMKEGDFPMILTLNSRETDIKVRFVPVEQHVHGLNEHGVVMNRVYGGYGLGKVFVKPLDHSISRSAIMLKTNSEEESKVLCEYLRSPEIQELANTNKISNVLSKELFKTIGDPLL